MAFSRHECAFEGEDRLLKLADEGEECRATHVGVDEVQLDLEP